jgi:hypothetical protein
VGTFTEMFWQLAMFTSYPPRLVAGEELRRLRVGFSNSFALFGRKHHRSANMSAC